MSVENELKDLILAKYKSIREFSVAIDMPYSTLDSIFKRGLDKASITNIIKICQSLGLSTDDLADGKLLFRNDKISVQTSSNEQVHLEKYRQLNNSGQDYIDDQMTFALSQPKYKKPVEKLPKAIP